MTYASFIKIDSTKLSFGNIHYKEKEFLLNIPCTNNSKKNIYISSIRTGCNCISYYYPKNIIKSKDNFNISISYHPSTIKGFFSKRILVILNDGEYFFLIPITGKII